MNQRECINIDKFNFSYGSTQVLDTISINIYKHETTSIIGMSGSGKSTILKSICGLNLNKQNHSGTIKINGIDNKDFMLSNNGKLSIMFQTLSLMPNLNVEENIKFPSKITNNNKIDNNLYDEIISMTGLFSHKEKYISELSGGMKTRVSLAGIYMTKPEIILLDEPFSSLDIAWKYELYLRYFELKKRFEATVIMVTHDIQEAILLSNKIYILGKNGSIFKEYSIKRDIEDFKSLKDFKFFLKSNYDLYLEIQNVILENMRND
ncbi:MAG: ATP-binding cassette domain-containing protein [Bacteroidetes bacterium]|nr:ATP-binding cassette domain-containing protein [Bacteroidota bacterium]